MNSRSYVSFVFLQELLRLNVPLEPKNVKGLTAYEIATRISRQCESVGEPRVSFVQELPSMFFVSRGFVLSFILFFSGVSAGNLLPRPPLNISAGQHKWASLRFEVVSLWPP